jgi:arylsulfatase
VALYCPSLQYNIKMRSFVTSVLPFSLVLLLVSCSTDEKRTNRPNIIYILADDLGYGELGAYGQEKIETPNLDKLATSGMIFSQHYSGSPVCAPSRGVLLTGLHTGHSYVRGNDEWASRGAVWDYTEMIKDPGLEGQRPIPSGTVTIGSVLKTAGYKTAVVGKWGLGAPGTEGVPGNLGFDLFYGYNCQRQAHTYFPVHLWKNDKRVFLNNDTISPGTKLNPGADPYNKDSYSNFWLNEYSPDLMFKEITSFINENSNNPFFLYWATPIPHAAIQAPPEWVEYYVEKFGDEEPYTGDRGYFPNRYPHAAYAAMISYLDNQVGLMVKQLKELGIYDNTVIIFTSDNGPTYNGGTDSPWFNSAGEFRDEYGFTKGFVYEGGIRVPMIASWPGIIKAGSKSDHISAFWDVLPTLSEIAGAMIPDSLDGISFLPTLRGESTQIEHKYLYWEFPSYGGQQAVRMGDWKAIRKDIFNGNMALELYNLADDPTELKNVATENPEIIKTITEILQTAHKPAVLEPFKISQLGDK